MANKALEFIIKAKDATGRVLKGIGVNLRALGRISKNMGRLTLSAFTKITKSVVAFSVAVIAAGAGMVKMASDADEIASKFGVVFSGNIDEANEAVKDLTKNYGLNATSAQKLLGDTGDLLTGFGFTQKQALALSHETQKLAIDLASFTNIEGGAKKASEALTKALLGESEQAKALGIVIRQDSQEYIDLVEDLQATEGKTLLQAKALAAITIATKQSKNAIGDFARTSKELANQMKLLKERGLGIVISVGRQIIKILELKEVFQDLNARIQEFIDTGQVEKWGERVTPIIDKVKAAIENLFAGGERRELQLAKIKELGVDLADKFVSWVITKGADIGAEIGKGILKGVGRGVAALPGKATQVGRGIGSRRAAGETAKLMQQSDLTGFNVRANEVGVLEEMKKNNKTNVEIRDAIMKLREQD